MDLNQGETMRREEKKDEFRCFMEVELRGLASGLGLGDDGAGMDQQLSPGFLP